MYTNPSGGQVYSSFASRANIKLAEPGSIIGMSPLQEIIDVTINKNSINVTAENFYNKGLINIIKIIYTEENQWHRYYYSG